MIYSGSFVMSNKHNFDNHKTNIDIFSSSSDLGSKLQERVLRTKKILEDDNIVVNLATYETNQLVIQ